RKDHAACRKPQEGGRAVSLIAAGRTMERMLFSAGDTSSSTKFRAAPGARLQPARSLPWRGGVYRHQPLRLFPDLDAGDLLALDGVNDRHVVAQDVTHAAIAAVRAERHPVRAAPNAHLADDLLAGRVEHVDGVRPAAGDPQFLLIGG